MIDCIYLVTCSRIEKGSGDVVGVAVCILECQGVNIQTDCPLTDCICKVFPGVKQ
jgi:hypothetical protein